MNKSRWDFLKWIFLVLVGAGLLWISLIAPILQKSLVGTQRIHFLNGQSERLFRLQGNVVLLNFWSPTCPPCVHELPALETLYQQYHSKGLIIIGVAVSGADPSRVRAMAALAKVTYPLAMDDDGKLSRAVGGVMVTPTQVVLSPSGKMMEKQEGEINPELVHIIEGYLPKYSNES